MSSETESFCHVDLLRHKTSGVANSCKTLQRLYAVRIPALYFRSVLLGTSQGHTHPANCRHQGISEQSSPARPGRKPVDLKGMRPCRCALPALDSLFAL